MNPNLSSANKSFNITTNGTTIIPGKFVLVGITINTKAGSGGSATLYDSNAEIGANSENKKATIDTVNNIGQLAYGIPMFNGIYIVTGGGTAPDLTVIYADTP